MTREEFEAIVEEEDFSYALECFAEENPYIKQNGYMGDFYRTDWHDIYGYPITENDKILAIEDIDDMFD